MFANFVKADAPPPPDQFMYWEHHKPFSLESYGNMQYGDCTRASQAQMARRLERLESRTTPKFDPDEVVRVYFEMTQRRYGGGDTGAYEEDALSDWRVPDYTFKDTNGHPHTIDAFLRLDPKNLTDIKRAIALSNAKGIKVCFSLPKIWSQIPSPQVWDVQRDSNGRPILTGDAMPGSWGGHSLMTGSYDARGFYLTHTWEEPEQLVTWDAVSAYCDEAHSIVDSIDSWRKHKAATDTLNLNAIVDAVNQVSSFKLKSAAD